MVLLVDTETDSEDEFDVHKYAFEVAFDECTQLYIRYCIYYFFVFVLLFGI